MKKLIDRSAVEIKRFFINISFDKEMKSTKKVKKGEKGNMDL